MRRPNWRSSDTRCCGCPTSAATCSASSSGCWARRRRRRWRRGSSTSGCTRAEETAGRHAELTAQHGDRFLVGIGVSHGPFIDRVKEPGAYRRPLEQMAAFLDGARCRRPAAAPPVTGCSPRSVRRCSSSPGRVAAGTHPYLVTPEHTRARHARRSAPIARSPASRASSSTPTPIGLGRRRACTSPPTSGSRTTPTTGGVSATPTTTSPAVAVTAWSTPWSCGATSRRSRPGCRSTATPEPTTSASRCSPMIPAGSPATSGGRSLRPSMGNT